MLLSSVVFSGCASKTAKEDEFTGFLGDYTHLELVSFEDGSKALRWVDQQLRTQHLYKKILLEPVTVYTGNLPTGPVSDSVITKIRDRIDGLLRAELSARDLLTDTPQANALNVTVAITGLNSSLEPLSIRELIPLKLVASGVMAVSGARDRDTTLLIESIAKDSLSGAILVRSVRKGRGAQLENNKEQISEAHLEALIRAWVTQWVELAEQMLSHR